MLQSWIAYRTFRSIQENFNSNLKIALLSLQKNSNIVIKPNDKGCNIVILDKSQYINMCEKILENFEWYEPIKPDRLEQAHSSLNDLITEANQQGVIDNDLKDFLSTKFPFVPVFYALPKIHKGIISPQEDPLCPALEALQRQRANLSMII